MSETPLVRLYCAEHGGKDNEPVGWIRESEFGPQLVRAIMIPGDPEAHSTVRRNIQRATGEDPGFMPAAPAEAVMNLAQSSEETVPVDCRHGEERIFARSDLTARILEAVDGGHPTKLTA